MNLKSIDPPVAAWRFEALDALAGIAFASRISTDERGDDELVYMRPPAFHPEPVGRSSIALGATRGSFQGGLFIEDREATFPSLDAVREFVRRGYVGGSAGDGGPDTPGGEGQPPPEPRDPDGNFTRGEPVNEGSRELDALAKDLARFKEHIANCRPGDATPTQWVRPEDGWANGADGDPILSGARHLVMDFLDSRRNPEPEEDDPKLPVLAQTLLRLGVEFHDFFDDIERRKPRLLARLSPLLRDPYSWYRWGWPGFWSHGDPLELLNRMDGPFVPVLPKGPISMLTWFTRFVSCPENALRYMPAREALERAVLASAVIVNRSADRYFWDADSQRKKRHELERDAIAWLREHLPRMAFARQFETAIAAVGRRT
jgi:hypothetical protein